MKTLAKKTWDSRGDKEKRQAWWEVYRKVMCSKE